MQEEVRAAVDRDLGRVDAAVARGDFWTAFDLVERIKEDFSGTPMAVHAADVEKRLRKHKEGRKVAAAIKKQKRFLPMLRTAEAFEDKADYVRARDTYRKIAHKAKGLPIAKTAIGRIERFEKDSDIRRLLEVADARAADRMLVRARDYEKKGKASKARELLERIVSEYGGTPAAQKARRRLGKE